MRRIVSLFIIALAIAPLAQAESRFETMKGNASLQVIPAPEQRSMTSAGSTLDSVKSVVLLGSIFVAVIMCDDLWGWLDGPVRRDPDDEWGW